MKRVSILLLTLLLPLSAVAQHELSQSARSGEYIYIFRLDDKQMNELFVKNRQIDDSYLADYVTRYRFDDPRPQLDRGNYITVQAVDNSLSYNAYTEDDLLYEMLAGEGMELFLSDRAGDPIAGARVKARCRNFRYDPSTMTYRAGKLGKRKIIEIDNGGVLHYLDVGQGYMQPRPAMLRTGRGSSKRDDGYAATVIFGKPIYRPGDTVRMKAWVTIRDRGITGDARLLLYNRYAGKYITLDTITPYRAGAYSAEFILSDTLQLRLDDTYDIELVDLANIENVFATGSIRYEDYELGRITFMARSSKNSYNRTEPVSLLMKAVDDNGMAALDGRVEITVSNGGVQEYYKESAFVPDVIWSHTVALDTPGEKEVAIPDSVLLDDVTMNYSVQCRYLSGDNEVQSAYISLLRNGGPFTIDFEAEADAVTITQRRDGEVMEGEAVLTTFGARGDVLDSVRMALPEVFTPRGNVSYFTVRTPEASSTYYVRSSDYTPVHFTLTRADGGKARLEVVNPGLRPFWYTVWRGEKAYDRGYTDQANLVEEYRGGDKFKARVDYFWGGYMQSSSQSLNPADKVLSVDVTTPQGVYPGQKADFEIEVRDGAGKPVPDADVTALAYTAKFANDYNYNLRREPVFAVDSKISAPYVNEKEWTGAGILEWERWKSEMGLERIEYYRFLHPEPVYTCSEPARDGVTQLAPYAVIDGALQGAHIVWIDNMPYWFSGSQQYQVYSFRVSPGPHEVRMRTHDRTVILKNVVAKEEYKTIVSADIASSRGDDLKVSVHDDKNGLDMLTSGETEYLDNFMFAVEDNFGQRGVVNNSYYRIPNPVELRLNNGMYVYYLNPSSQDRISEYYDTGAPRSLVAGPIPYGINADLYVGGAYRQMLPLEGGFEYSVAPQLIRMRSWDRPPYSTYISQFTPPTDFRQQVLSVADVDSLSRYTLEYALRHTLSDAKVKYGDNGPQIVNKAVRGQGRLQIALGGIMEYSDQRPVLVALYDPQDSVFSIYSGSHRGFSDFPAGDLKLMLYMPDRTCVERDVQIFAGGENYLKIDSVTMATGSPGRAPFFEELIARVLVPEIKPAPVVITQDLEGNYSERNAAKGVASGIVQDYAGNPLAGVIIRDPASTLFALTNADGAFEIAFADSLKRFTVSTFSEQQQVTMSPGYEYAIVLTQSIVPALAGGLYGISSDNSTLDEVVVVGYAGRQRRGLFAGLATSKSVHGEVGAIDEESVMYDMVEVAQEDLKAAPAAAPQIPEGGSGGTVPMIILNGLPYGGQAGDIDQAAITSYKSLTPEEAVKLYGEQARGGVVIITTRQEEGALSGSEGMSLRRNFRDDAFWEPALTTGSDGKVAFTATYPDDITAWKGHFYVMAPGRYIGQEDVVVRSFKALSASVSLPRFAIEGDRFDALGRINNYMADTLSLERTVSVGDSSSRARISVANAYVEPISVAVGAAAQGEIADSVTVKYTIDGDDGFFDGEQRQTPIYRKGVLETHGMFRAIGDDSLRSFRFDPAAGEVTVHAEASSLELFMREIGKVVDYPYMCNEQMASKLKALVMKKRVCALFGIDFDDDRVIEKLIRDLNRNRNGEGMWGWWDRSDTQPWITRQVVEAMLAAEKEGYAIELDRTQLTDRFVVELNNAIRTQRDNSRVKNEYNQIMLMLQQLGAQLDYGMFAARADTIPDRSLYGKLLSMRSGQAAGRSVDMDSLMSWSSATMTGGLYWGERAGRIEPLWRYIPYENEVQATLMAYDILGAAQGKESEMERIRNYFFEIRREGSWRNTYESTKIMEAIIPDMLAPGESYSEVKAEINGDQVAKFPYSAVMEPSQAVTVRKQGTLPLFFTAYQQTWNSEPERENKGFEVRSLFRENGDTVSVLGSGQSVELAVTLRLDADADYVMIEVPIPAGCSYEEKSQIYYGCEIHREYYRDRVSIFCTRLLAGEHIFTVRLTPRFSGEYTLNPARAELMYFPTFYGREGLREIEIK